MISKQDSGRGSNVREIMICSYREHIGMHVVQMTDADSHVQNR